MLGLKTKENLINILFKKDSTKNVVPYLCRLFLFLGLSTRTLMVYDELIFQKSLFPWFLLLSSIFLSIIISFYFLRINILLFYFADSFAILGAIFLTKDPATDLFLFILLPIIYLIHFEKKYRVIIGFLFVTVLCYLAIVILIQLKYTVFNIETFLRDSIIKSIFILIFGSIVLYFKLKYEVLLDFKNAIFNQSFYSIISSNKEGLITDINQHALDLLKISKEECIGKHVYDFYNNKQYPQEINKYLEENEFVQNYKAQLKSKFNEIIPIELSVKKLSDGGTVGFFEDKRENKIQYLVRFGRELNNKDLSVENLITNLLKSVLEIICGSDCNDEIYCAYSSYNNKKIEIVETNPPQFKEKIKKHIIEIDLKSFSKSGIVGMSVQNESLINCGNVIDENNFIDIPEIKTGSYIAIPLKNDGVIVGVLSISHPTLNFFSNEDEKILETLGLFFEIALLRKKYLGLLEGLREINQILAFTKQNQEKTNFSLVKIIKDYVKCDIVTLHVYDETSKKFQFPFAHIGINDLEIIKLEGDLKSTATPYKILEYVDPVKCMQTSECEIFNSSFNKRENVKSAYAVKLVSNNIIVGVLILGYRHLHEFTDRESNYLNLYAQSLSSALHSFNIKSTLKYKLGLNTKFTNIINSIDSINYKTSIIDNLLTSTMELIHFDQGSFQLIDNDGNRQLMSTINTNPDFYDSKLLRNINADKLLQKVFKTELKAFYIEDTKKEEYWEFHPFTQEIKSWIGIPLVYNEEIIGLITLDFFKTKTCDSFTLNILTNYGKYLAQVFKNLELIKEQDKYINELEKAESLAMIGLLYGEDIHFAANHLGSARVDLADILESNKIFDQEVISQIKSVYSIIESFLDLIEGNLQNIKRPSPKFFNLIKTININLYNQPFLNRIQILNPFRDKTIMIFGFERQVTQVFRVIVHNTFKVLRQNGKIEIYLKEIEVNNNIYYEITFSDNGPGIPEDILNKLFTFKGPDINKKSFGIGLAWAKYFLKECKGDLQCKTTLGEGTKMIVTLPKDITKIGNTILIK